MQTIVELPEFIKRADGLLTIEEKAKVVVPGLSTTTTMDVYHYSF